MLSMFLIGIGILWCLRAWRLNQGKCFMFHDWHTVDTWSEYYDWDGSHGWCGENKICRRCKEKFNTIPMAKKTVRDKKEEGIELAKLANS